MELWPAVDWLDGRMVRLQNGNYEAPTVYSSDPLGLFLSRYGALPKRLHLVDLRGARDGTFTAWTLLGELCQAGIAVEAGGGFRDRETIERALDMGAARIVLGTRASRELPWASRLMAHLGPERLVASLDILHGHVRLNGWLEEGPEAEALWQQLFTAGFVWCNVTDIDRDGTLSGLNPEFWRRVRHFPGQLGAGGGITSPDDLTVLESLGIARAVVGKAWLSGQIDLTHWEGVF